MRYPALVSYLAAHSGVQKKTAAEALDLVVSGIIEAIKDGEEVSLQGLGKFRTIERAAKRCRNPRTNELMVVPAHRSVSFNVSRTLSDEVAGRRRRRA